MSNPSCELDHETRHNFTALERLHEIWVAGYAHNYILAGGLEHEFYDFPYIGNNNPNLLIFFRGVGIPPTSNSMYMICIKMYLHIYINMEIHMPTYTLLQIS